jgi:hypothetical protein
MIDVIFLIMIFINIIIYYTYDEAVKTIAKLKIKYAHRKNKFIIMPVDELKVLIDEHIFNKNVDRYNL